MTSRLYLAGSLAVLTGIAWHALGCEALPVEEVDSNNPVITVQSPSDNSIVNTSTVTVQGQVTDDNHVKHVSYKVNSGATTTVYSSPGEKSGPSQYPFSFAAPLRAGSNTIEIAALDQVNNTSVHTLTVTHDGTAPTVSISRPTSNETVSGSDVTVEATVRDDARVDRVTYRLNSAAEQAVTITAGASVNVSIPVTGLTEGSNTITITGYDRAGNKGSATVDVRRVIPPVVARVQVEPKDAQLNIGQSRALSARAYSATGAEIGNTTFTWSSSNAAVAKVSTAGVVEGVSPGTAAIVASTGAGTSLRADTARVTVLQQAAKTVTLSADTVFSIKQLANNDTQVFPGERYVGDHEHDRSKSLQAFARFPLTGISSSALVESAKLTVSNIEDLSAGTVAKLGGLYVELADNPMTLNNGSLSTGAVLISAAATSSTVVVDIKSLVQQAAQQGIPLRLRFRLQKAVSGDQDTDLATFTLGTLEVVYRQ